LLEKVSDLDVSDLKVPKGVTIITVDDQVNAGLQALKDADSYARRLAAWDLRDLAPYSERVMPALANLLATDQDKYVRHVAADCLGGTGVQATFAVAVLKKGLEDPEANVRDACQKALERTAAFKTTPEREEQMRRERAIAKDINEFKANDGT